MTRFTRHGRQVRRVAAGLAFVGALFAGGLAIGAGGQDDNGRSAEVRRGTPSDEPAPAPRDSDAGRDVVVAPNVPDTARVTGSSSAAPPAALPADNGRGGPDPARGPQTAVSSAEAVRPIDVLVGGFDNDGGTAPGAAAASTRGAAAAEAAPGPPVDQDVPGAPTGGPPGRDQRSNDSDG